MITRRGKWLWFDMRINGVRIRESLHTDERGLALERAKDLRDRLLSTRPGDIRLDEFSTKYIEWAWASKPASARADELRLARVKAFFAGLGIEYLGDVTPYHVEQLKAHLLALDRARATINRYLQLLRGMFYRAIDWEMYSKTNPLKRVRFYREEPCRKLLSQDEIRQIIEAAEAIAAKPRSSLQRAFPDIVRLAVNTGLRKSEILNLRWSDVRGDEITLKGKGGRMRTIPLNDEARQVIERQPRRESRIFGNLGLDYTSTFRRTVEAIRKRTGITWTFHDTRHFFASTLLARGVDIVTVGALLGHSKITTSLIYGHTDEKRKKKAVDLLSV